MANKDWCKRYICTSSAYDELPKTVRSYTEVFAVSKLKRNYQVAVCKYRKHTALILSVSESNIMDISIHSNFEYIQHNSF